MTAREQTRKYEATARRPAILAAKLAIAVALPVLATAGCGEPGHLQDSLKYPSQIEALAIRRERPDPLAEAQASGRKVFEHYCQICHGAEGQGDGFNSTNLAISPRDFSNLEFWKTATDERLTSAISQGGESVEKSVLMPAWGRTLSEEHIRDVVAYLRTIPQRAKQEEATSKRP